MNDITDTKPVNGAPSAQKKEEAPSPPTEAEFERIAIMMARDLRRAQTDEYANAARSHFTGSGPERGSVDNQEEAHGMLETLSRKHTHEQIMFRGSIGKLRSYYANARERQATPDHARPSAQRSSDLERSL